MSDSATTTIPQLKKMARRWIKALKNANSDPPDFKGEAPVLVKALLAALDTVEAARTELGIVSMSTKEDQSYDCANKGLDIIADFHEMYPRD